MNQSAEMVARLISGDLEEAKELTTKQVNIRVNVLSLARVKILAQMAGTTMTEMVNMILSAGLQSIEQALDPSDRESLNDRTVNALKEELQ